ncbi:hypothetical protein BCR37DRAFT_393849 [Protomyces lactucae-debilis]|uniref:Uncharacterized protein n=1 Tax=Protomyces lactucae-debilis TaxID=2754530 RepID=A0A1Y2F9E3_PROLT|nr:uncharacterized protein BCR37DRAFT_393849 [Protomyces lactucae-debilis]ORY80493.1 hypothetical protein BCR37DRAFT_393849 [Protomyces lactucae-debilis]
MLVGKQVEKILGAAFGWSTLSCAADERVEKILGAAFGWSTLSCAADERVEKILGAAFGWSTLSCAADERVDAMSNPAQHEQEVQRKIRHAERRARRRAETVTFGVEASSFRSGLNQHGMKMRLLERSYNAISKPFKLQQKSEFRRKLGATDDPVYICYPKGKMGASAIRAIMRFLSDDPDNK